MSYALDYTKEEINTALGAAINSRYGANKHNWRITPTACTDSGGQASVVLSALTSGSVSPDLVIAASTTRTLTFDIPALEQDGMVVFDLDADSDITYSITYEESFDEGSTYSSAVNPTLAQPNATQGFRLQKHIISAGAARRVRLGFAHNQSAGSNDTGGRIIRGLRFYEFDPNNRHDYILCIGASIMELAVRDRDWRAWWAGWYGRDPAVFNEGMGGYSASNLASNIASILARHSHASHVLIHIGGNEVTLNRPYADASQAELDSLYGYLETIANAVIAAGASPVFSRLSYRNYTASPAVNGQSNPENGAEPFNTAVIDHIIERFSPMAFDGEKGMIDPYGFLHDNYHLIDTDLDSSGIHPYGYGSIRLSKYWARAFGSLLDHAGVDDIPDESASAGVLGAKQSVQVSFGVETTNIWHDYHTGDLDAPEGIRYAQVSGASLQSLSGLANSEQEACGIGIDVTTAFEGLGNFGIATNDTNFLARAKKSFGYVSSGYGAAVFDITGLDDNATYQVELFASRSGIASRLTKFTVGANTDTLDAADNADSVVTFTSISPTSGKITVQVEADSASSATYGYLNALRITRE